MQKILGHDLLDSTPRICQLSPGHEGDDASALGGGGGRRSWISSQRGAFTPGLQNLNVFTSEICEMLVISLYHEDKYGINQGLQK